MEENLPQSQPVYFRTESNGRIAAASAHRTGKRCVQLRIVFGVGTSRRLAGCRLIKAEHVFRKTRFQSVVSVWIDMNAISLAAKICRFVTLIDRDRNPRLSESLREAETSNPASNNQDFERGHRFPGDHRSAFRSTRSARSP